MMTPVSGDAMPDGVSGPPDPRLTVAAVARRLGVAPATLRTWDRRYGLGPTLHTAGAHRRYSRADAARLAVERATAAGPDGWDGPDRPRPAPPGRVHRPGDPDLAPVPAGTG